MKLKATLPSHHRKKSLFLIASFFIVTTLIVAVIALIVTNQRASAAPGPITGSVFNDANGNGVRDAGENGFANVAIVNLYNSSGNYVKSRISDANGNYSLAGLSAGTYYISVYNTTRASLLNSPPGLINDTGSHVEQTYASVGAGAGTGSGPICVSPAPSYVQRANYASSPSEWTTGAQNGTNSGPCFGGRKADMTNTVLSSVLPLTYPANSDFTTGNAGLNTQKSVTKVVLTNDGGVGNVDFGLSANVVTNTENTGQGSLRQFIANSNITGNASTMRFVPSVAPTQGSGANRWWQINQGTTSLPTISNNNTTIDGRAWSNTNAATQLDINTGALTGPTVGTTNYKISDYNKPELEVTGDVRAGGQSGLFTVNASNATIANVGLNSTINYPSTASYFVQQTGGSSIMVRDNLMGVNPGTGANSANRPQFAIQTGYLLSLNSSGRYSHNFISTNDLRGMVLANGLLGAGNVNPLVLGDWTIDENDGPSAAVSFGGGTTLISVRHNRMPAAWLDAAALNSSLGLHTLTENTITGGAGVRLFAGLQNTITKNVITNATGSNPGVSVGNLSTGNFISQNSFSGNSGNAIDLNTDGVSTNDLINCLTLSPELIGLANLGIARPTLSNAKLEGSTLTVDIGYCGVGIYNVELYKATPGVGDDNAGEGSSYLGTLTSLSLLNGTLRGQTLPVGSNLQPGDAITAIVVNPVTGNTSEFSPNVIAASPPATPATAPDMTSATDTGASNSDKITSNTRPAFTGICTNGETVTLYIDDVAIAPTQVCSGGIYTITPTNTVSEGDHTISSTFSNSSGESGKSPSRAFTIDTTPPAVPSTPDMTDATDTGASNSDNITANNRPIFTGTCSTNSSVTLYVDNIAVGVQTCTSGTYTIQPTNAVSDGNHTVTASATDVAGNESSRSSGLATTIDTTAPAAPTISNPADKAHTNNNQPTFGGMGENGATVTVRDNNGNVICTATVSSNVWSCAATQVLADGTRQFSATQTDTAGNVSAQSNTTTVTVDTVPPAAPTITNPAHNTITNQPRPVMSGQADANATVRLTLNGAQYATVTANASGVWSYTPTADLGNATYDVVAVQLDEAGNVSPASDTTTFTVDRVRPTVTVNRAADQPDPTTNNNVRFTVVFSKPINPDTFAPSDITVGSSPESEAPYVSSVTQINSTTWEVVITGMPNRTTVSASLNENAIEDAAGNGNTASTSTDNSVLYEVNSPNVTHQIANTATPAIYGECVNSHALQIKITGNDIDKTYTINCSNNEWMLEIPDTLSDGSYNVIVTDLDVDNLTNPVPNQTNALVIDTARPTITVNQAPDQDDPTNVNEARFVITSSELLSEPLTAETLTVSGTNGDVSITHSSDTEWIVTVTNMQSNDTVTVSLDENKVEDIAGNGNTASTSTDNSVTYDATAPDAPTITAPANDLLTNNATPVIEGTGEDGTAVTVRVDGAVITCEEGNPIVVANGTWTCTPATPLVDGTHTITATLTDAAGNVSEASDPLTITIDTTPPAKPSTVTLAPGSDTGASNSDGITSETNPQFTGTCTTGDTVTLYDGNTVIAEGTCENGTYTLTPTSPLGEGEHEITITLTDAAGNVSEASDPLTITIDTTAPDAPTITSPPNNSVQNSTGLEIVGTGEPGSTVTVTVDGNEVLCEEETVIVAQNGSWTCTVAVALDDGEHAIVVTQTDVAGNVSGDTTITITVDTTPPAVPATPQLNPASDTGISNTDGITNDTTPTIQGECEDGTVINLYSGSQKIGQANCTNGTYSITTDELEEGSYEFSVSATDAVGNESNRSQPITVVIDTTAPAQLTVPDLAVSSDSGTSQTDNITNVVRPQFNGICSTGDQVTLYINDAVAGQATCGAEATYSIFPTQDLPEGTHTVSVTATDIAGNTNARSSSLQIIVDTTAPAAATLTAPQNNTVTRNNTPVISGTGENDAAVTVLANNAAITCEEAPLTVIDNEWRCTPTTALADGEYEITARLTDAAGNVSADATPHTITIDTTAPATPSTPQLNPASDTGISNSDGITNDTTPTIEGECETGDTIRLAINNNPTNLSALCEDGTYSITVNPALTAGDYAFTVTATDAAGNTSDPSDALMVKIVTQKPNAAQTDLTAESDTGRSDSDKITSDTTPTFSASCLNNYTVALYIDNTEIGTALCANGSYAITATTPLADGDHMVTIRVTDIAGNVSDPSSPLVITVDTTAPNAPAITEPANNTVTNDATPTIRGSGENNAHVTMLVDGTEIACVDQPIIVTNGTWECTPATNLTDGEKTITAQLTDTAGNTSPASSATTLTIDTTAPDAPETPDMTTESDTGISNSDNITSNTRPFFTGSCLANDTVVLYVDDEEVARGTCNNDEYLLQPSNALAEGNYNVTARFIDPANNQSALSSALAISIVTTSPAAPAAPTMTPESDTGSSQTDGITNDAQPTFTGLCGNAVTVILSANGTVIGQAACTDGEYSIEPTTNLNDGTYDITVTVVDTAGNTSDPSQPQTITIDTTPPQMPVITSPEDGSTVTTHTPTVTGTGETGTVVAIGINDETRICTDDSTTTVTDGLWDCSTTTHTPNGDHTVSAAKTDTAGNVSQARIHSFTINTAPPAQLDAPDMTAETDTGSSNSDNYTANTKPTFVGNCSADNIVTLYANGAQVAEGACVNGAYSLTPAAALANGTYDITVTATNLAGNASPESPALSITIDTTIPAAPGVPDLTADTDSGVSNTDNITNVTLPRFTGSCSGTTIELRSNGVLVGQGVCVNGAYALLPTSNMPEGTHQITTTVVSQSGVRSPASPSLSVTIDTTAPQPPVIVVPTANALTNNNKITMSGLGETNASLQMHSGTEPIACSQANPVKVSGGVWTCTPDNALAEGIHALRATQTDIAGNVSNASPITSITVDTVAPPRQSRPTLDPASDSGVSNTDNLTNVTMPRIIGNCTIGETIRLRLGGVVQAQMLCTDGTYAMFPLNNLADGTHNFSVTATDQAGNTSPTSITLNIRVVTSAPKPSIPFLHAGSDSGMSQTDGITNVTRPTITGVCNLNESVRVYINNVFAQTANCQPPFYVQPSTNLPAGTHTVYIEVTDTAGNNSPRSDTYSFTIDNFAPNIPNVTTPAAGTTPTVTTANYTTAGTAEPNVQVFVWEGSTRRCETMSSSNGSWSCTLTNLVNGQRTYTFSAVDIAGNPSPASNARTLNINRP